MFSSFLRRVSRRFLRTMRCLLKNINTAKKYSRRSFVVFSRFWKKTMRLWVPARRRACVAKQTTVRFCFYIKTRHGNKHVSSLLRCFSSLLRENHTLCKRTTSLCERDTTRLLKKTIRFARNPMHVAYENIALPDNKPARIARCAHGALRMSHCAHGTLRHVTLRTCHIAHGAHLHVVDLSICRFVDFLICRFVDLSTCRFLDLSTCRSCAFKSHVFHVNVMHFQCHDMRCQCYAIPMSCDDQVKRI